VRSPARTATNEHGARGHELSEPSPRRITASQQAAYAQAR